MKAGTIIAGIVILAAIFGGIYFLNQPLLDSKVSKPQENFEKTTSDNTIPSSTETGSYQEYAQSTFEEAADKTRVLFFYTNWCPVCKPADAEFKSNMSKLPEGLVLFRINYNDSDTDQTEKDLAKKYGITYQHTFVQVDKNGDEITKWNGGSLEKLLSTIK